VKKKAFSAPPDFLFYTSSAEIELLHLISVEMGLDMLRGKDENMRHVMYISTQRSRGNWVNKNLVSLPDPSEIIPSR
jgi:hypothetical protein